MNQHRKLIFDKFYQWISDNSEILPVEVNDVAAEIWNLEEECEFWRIYAYKFRRLSQEKSCLAEPRNE